MLRLKRIFYLNKEGYNLYKVTLLRFCLQFKYLTITYSGGERACLAHFDFFWCIQYLYVLVYNKMHPNIWIDFKKLMRNFLLVKVRRISQINSFRGTMCGNSERGHGIILHVGGVQPHDPEMLSLKSSRQAIYRTIPWS